MYAKTIVKALLVTAGLLCLTTQPLHAGILPNGDFSPTDPSSWSISTPLRVGVSGVGTLSVTEGSSIASSQGFVGDLASSDGTVTIDGIGSTWTNADRLYVAYYGEGKLNINNGASVTSTDRGFVGTKTGSVGILTVNGVGSTWLHTGDIYIGNAGNGTLNIINGGLVSPSDTLTMATVDTASSVINMSTGGMLALPGDADDSLTQFIGLISGYQSNNLNWWDGSQWTPLSTATLGTDYTLEYIDTVGADLEGCTILTVGTAVPEPSTLALLFCLVLGLVIRRVK